MTCFDDVVQPSGFWSAIDDVTAYDDANQLLRIDSLDAFTTFTYDNNGNMAEEVSWKAPKSKSGKAPSVDENRAYFYDFDDRLWKVEIARGESEAMTD